MANIASQKKRILRTERERDENRRYTSSVKTYFRRLEAAVEAKDADAVEAEFRELVLAHRPRGPQRRAAQQHRRPQEGPRRALRAGASS